MRNQARNQNLITESDPHPKTLAPLLLLSQRTRCLNTNPPTRPRRDVIARHLSAAIAAMPQANTANTVAAAVILTLVEAAAAVELKPPVVNILKVSPTVFTTAAAAA